VSSDAVLDTVNTESDELDGVSSRKERVLQRKKLGSFAESEFGGEKRVTVRGSSDSSSALIPISKQGLPGTVKPTWHAPWKRMKVISGHLGWVRCIAVDPSNEWFATGSNDRTIKIWDMASSVLKLTLTGHISNVMGLAISESRPYMFSVGEDKKAKCWDLEVNKVVRHYHGHMSGIYCCALHPTIDLFITGSRDSSVRVWDVRTKTPVHVLTGHNHTVAAVLAQATEPQVISGSYDSTIRCWDLIAGKTMSVLTHHKKGIRALCLHPHEYDFPHNYSSCSMLIRDSDPKISHDHS
jgi:pleiotropic regulator 1